MCHSHNRGHMKKLLYLIPVLLVIVACGAHSQPDPNIADMINATLTSIAQNAPQDIVPQSPSTPISVEVQLTAPQSQPLPSDTPTSITQSQSLPLSSFAPIENITYFWPRTLPEGFDMNCETSYANSSGFMLTFINPSIGAISLMGGAEVTQNCDNNPGESVKVRGLGGCFPYGTGGGFAVAWKEYDTYYSVGGLVVSKELALTVAEDLNPLDLYTFLTRLGP